MGTLRIFNLAHMMELWGTRYLFETGTGNGDSVRYATYFNLKHIYSVEINEQLVGLARGIFAGDSRVSIIHGRSAAALEVVLGRHLDNSQLPFVFWLDAHFPGADFGLANYGDEQDDDTRLPLQRELDVIRKFRPKARDVILIDDLRIYEDGDFQQGPLPPEHDTLPPERRNLDFLRPFEETHNIERLYMHTGYLTMTPK